MRYYGLTDVGLRRKRNEDAWSASSWESGFSLFVVSDGVGGRVAGEIASKIVVETIPQCIEGKIAPEMDAHSLERVMYQSLVLVSNTMREHAKDVQGRHGLAATVTCVLLGKGVAVIAHMGDSRAYKMAGNRLCLLTKDHTTVQMLMDQGKISEIQAKGHPSTGHLYQAMGMDGDPEPATKSFATNEGDRFLLCTDGLHGQIEDALIQSIMDRELDPMNACRELIGAALDAGGKDNICAVVIDVEE